MHRSIFRFALFLPLLAIACQESVLSPIGDGETLEATVDGSRISFVVEPAVVEYDATFNRVEIGGTDAPANQTLLITFRHDVENDPTPAVVTGPEVTINLARPDGSGTASYRCEIGAGDCRVTVDFSSLSIVEGSFSGTLENVDDPGDEILVTDGKFSVSLD